MGFCHDQRSPDPGDDGGSLKNKRTMKTVLIVLAAIILWQPLQPVRNVTAEALYTAGDLIRR
jgi:hypothetical protein